MKHFSLEEKEKQQTESHKSRVEREFCLHNLENREEKENYFKNLTNQEEKENFFFTILKIEKRKRTVLKISQIKKRKRVFVSKSWKSRRETEMKIQFPRSREKNMSHFFSSPRLLSMTDADDNRRRTGWILSNHPQNGWVLQYSTGTIIFCVTNINWQTHVFNIGWKYNSSSWSLLGNYIFELLQHWFVRWRMPSFGKILQDYLGIFPKIFVILKKIALKSNLKTSQTNLFLNERFPKGGAGDIWEKSQIIP